MFQVFFPGEGLWQIIQRENFRKVVHTHSKNYFHFVENWITFLVGRTTYSLTSWVIAIEENRKNQQKTKGHGRSHTITKRLKWRVLLHNYI